MWKGVESGEEGGGGGRRSFGGWVYGEAFLLLFVLLFLLLYSNLLSMYLVE